MRPTIVCGVDRSPNARTAARLGKALARRLGLGIELIYVVDRARMAASGGGKAAAKSVTEAYLDLRVGVQVKPGLAADVLSDAGRDATLLVVGTRGEGAVRQALMGSVSSQLTRDPASPVVVVPPGASGTDSPLGGRTVVCGVRDGRDVAPAHAAARLASDLGLTLTLAHVLGPPAIAVSPDAPAPSLLRPTADELQEATHVLDAIARSVGTNIPVHVEIEVLDGPPGPQLDRLAAARDASMLVVGACDQGPLASALTGAPARHLMRHGVRPVMVCPRPQRLTAARMRASGEVPSLAS